MLEKLTLDFSRQLSSLSFDFDGVVYNPLEYAWDNHREYLERYLIPGARVLLLGMNPGPFGMVQTGVPFGAVPMVRDYLGISNPVGKPAIEHPGRPILGMDCPKPEVSGLRLWSLVQSRFPRPEEFFSRFSVMNYCPLAFLDGGARARNITPDKLPAAEQRRIGEICDFYLASVIKEMGCDALIGVGVYAQKRLEAVAPAGCRVGVMLHPSPASPAANSGWAEKASSQLRALGVWD